MQKMQNFFKSLLVTGLSAGLIVVATPAFALQMPGFSPQNNQSPAQNVPAAPNKSYNWAGYTALGNNFTSVSGTWNVPQINSPVSPSADATWVGIGGVSSQDLIQAGTQAITESGGTVYQAWFETLPQGSQTVPLTIDAGDSISASVTQQSPGQWLLSLRDNTSGQSYQTTAAYNSSLSSAEWVQEMPSVGRGFISLDNFGSITFTGATATENGSTVTAALAGAQPMTMLNSGGNQTLANPSALGGDGASFTVTRTAVTATPSVIGVGGGGYRRHSRGLTNFSNGNGAQIFRLFGERGGSFTIQIER